MFEQMLYTNLKHIEIAAMYKQVLLDNANVVVICGRMGEYSIPVFRLAEELEELYPQVQFFDIEYDNPESGVVCEQLGKSDKQGIPYIVYAQNGDVVHQTSGMQTKQQMIAIIYELYKNELEN